MASPRSWLKCNQQYSVTALTDGSGAVVERYAYSAYGSPTITDASGTTRSTTAVGNRYTYTGREYDETLALYHYRARMYDSAGGRFVSRDPIGYEDGWLLYRAYFVMLGMDPSGNGFFGGVIGGIGGAIGGTVGGGVVGGIVGGGIAIILVITTPVSAPIIGSAVLVGVGGAAIGSLGGAIWGSIGGSEAQDNGSTLVTVFVDSVGTGCEVGVSVGSLGIINTLRPDDPPGDGGLDDDDDPMDPFDPGPPKGNLQLPRPTPSSPTPDPVSTHAA